MTFEKNNVRPMETVGKNSIPITRILMQEATTEQEKAPSWRSFKRYYLGDRAVRTAKVKVAVRPEEKNLLRVASRRSLVTHDQPASNERY